MYTHINPARAIENKLYLPKDYYLLFSFFFFLFAKTSDTRVYLYKSVIDKRAPL